MTGAETRPYSRWMLNQPEAVDAAPGAPLDGESWLSASRRDTPDGIELEWRREKAWPVESSSVGLARDLAWTALVDWRLPALSDDVRLCVSELVTNAIRHAEWPEDVTCQSCTVTMRLTFSPLTFLTVEVDDGDTRPPRMPGPLGLPDFVGEPETSGRGLALVAALADGLDWWPWRHGGGKTLRCWWDLAGRGLAAPYRFRPDT